ncbi:cholesterol 24-hydroxylase-like [Engraulis encrasicolus]|uniref:cholesterol 24-hydroxylase-like n=1 Tax=Engraulis encrasicolus TaxID=184585 RepID=UPI002FCE8691
MEPLGSLILGWVGYLVLILLGVVLVAFVSFVLYVQYIHQKFDHIPGPPRDNFLLGHLPTILSYTRTPGRHINEIFLEWTETYGPVCRINSLHTAFVIVSCPEATKEILMSPKISKDPLSYKRLHSLFGTRFLGTGLVTAVDHEVWYKQRRIMDPAFSSVYLRGLIDTFNERAERLMTKLSEFADREEPVHMHKLINSFTMDVITKIAFGVDLDLLNTQDSPFPQAIETCLKGMVCHTRDPFFQLWSKNKKAVREIKEACQLLRKTGAMWINERKKAVQSGQEVPMDILTQILKSAEENKTDDDEEIMLDNFVTFFIAGQETTANQIAFAIMALGRHPEILQRLKEEVDDVLGVKQDISNEDLGRLTYLNQVLKETLRLYPTAPGTTRRIAKDMVINGIRVPGNCGLLFSSFVSSRLDRFFKDPLTFDPERFNMNAPKPYYCYFPFALGPRSCLGQNFSQIEAKVAMAKLLQRFDFSLVPGQSFEILDTGTLRPESGVMCTLKLRGTA